MRRAPTTSTTTATEPRPGDLVWFLSGRGTEDPEGWQLYWVYRDPGRETKESAAGLAGNLGFLITTMLAADAEDTHDVLGCVLHPHLGVLYVETVLLERVSPARQVIPERGL